MHNELARGQQPGLACSRTGPPLQATLHFLAAAVDFLAAGH